MSAHANRALRVGGVPEHFNLPWHLGIEDGSFAAAGTPCEWVDYSTGTGAMLADLAGGELDLAVLLTEGAALGLAREAPIEAVSLFTQSPLIWGIHVPPGLAVGSVAELRGRRVAISRPGSGSHLMALALGLDRGWPVADMQFEVVDNLAGAVAALAGGSAEVFLWEHFTTQVEVDRGHFRRIADFVAPWPAWVVCAEASIWQSDAERIRSLIARVALKAQGLAVRQDRARLIADRYGLHQDAVGEWLARTRWVGQLTSPATALADARAMLAAAGALA